VKGYWDMHCWNALSARQQRELIERGGLDFGFVPEAEDGCPRPASLEITCIDDPAPGPRFYCTPCAIDYLSVRPDARPT
jgi:hypothetical protein